jgi:hypothetical protein
LSVPNGSCEALRVASALEPGRLLAQSEIANAADARWGRVMAHTANAAQPHVGASEPVTCADVIRSEAESIDARREAQGRAAIRAFPGFGTQSTESANEIPDTVGLALSGGGVRSAAFCLGALQSLHLSAALARIDYLSTVSGGGYIGASLSGAMTVSAGDFPFSNELAKGEAPGVQHIRDYSNYLIPHGFFDVLQSIGIYLRGLAANVLLVLPWLLLAAALTVFIHPNREDLQSGLPLDFWPYRQLAPKFFHVSLALALLFPLLLMGWALWRSGRKSLDAPEVPGFLTRSFAIYLVGLFLVVFGELQPFAVDSLFDFVKENAAIVDPSDTTAFFGPIFAAALHYAAVVLAPVAAAFGFLGNKLGWLLKGVSESSTIMRQAMSVAIKALMMVSALALPLVLWLVYLRFCYWAIAHEKGWGPLFIPGALLLVASWFLSPNANSLHRLYRDRLSKAFLFRPKDDVAPDEAIHPLPRMRLTELEDGPYHLINTALNIQASQYANRRGRNADFFLFSRNYVGSQTTGYVPTQAMQRAVTELDLATAMAVSGAAASSNMGSSSIKQWTPSLALLNVRLGYWIRNPKFVLDKSRLKAWLNYLFNPYFLYEMFGQLNERRWYVNLSDGGHVENLGAYELLRRRCCLIIIVDAEADPEMNFDSLIKLQRYALIDLGVRIELPWREIRDATRATSEVIATSGGPGLRIEARGPHCAYGKIYYPGTKGAVIEGRLLYVKSSLTGDESDYVIDYKRRHASFPHETTGDQFFSEEQFEAYRSLGFHAVQGVFSGRDKIATVDNQQFGTGTAGAKEARKDAMGDGVHDPLSEMWPVLRFERPGVLPTPKAKGDPEAPPM